MSGNNLESELAAEVKFYLADASGENFTQIPGSLGPGVVGDRAQFKDATTIDLSGYKSKPALAEPEDKELKFKYFRDNTAQDKLRTAARNYETRLVKVEFTPLAKSYTFELVFGGWQLDAPEFNEDIVMTIFARKNTSFATIEEELS